MKFIIRSSKIQQLSQVPVTAIHPMADAAAPAEAPAATAAAATAAPAAAPAAASTAAPATGEGMDWELGIVIIVFQND